MNKPFIPPASPVRQQIRRQRPSLEGRRFAPLVVQAAPTPCGRAISSRGSQALSRNFTAPLYVGVRPEFRGSGWGLIYRITPDNGLAALAAGLARAPLRCRHRR